MTSKERVAATILGEPADRIPLYGWVREHHLGAIEAKYGSLVAFENAFGFDLHHGFGGPGFYFADDEYWRRKKSGENPEPPELLDLPLSDPDDSDAWKIDLPEDRFVYFQTPGIFEGLNGLFGIEDHLMWMAEYPDELAEVYARKADWNRRFAMNALDLGADMVHVSDDWGGQTALLFSPSSWRELIAPAHAVTAKAVRDRGAFLSLHTDGYVLPVVDGAIELGYQLMHPWQASAGMSLQTWSDRYRGRLAIMGGIDVQTTLGFDDRPRLEREIREVVEAFRGGGGILCTSHFAQPHCSLAELEFAFEVARSAIDRV